MRLICLFLIAACGASPEDQLQAARSKLSAGQFDPAIGDAGEALKASPDDKTAWGLELVILEADARSGKAAETKAQLDKLAAAHPDRVSASLYSSTADQLKAAGKTAEAVEVLDAGNKRFPDDATIKKAIEQSKEAADPAALEKLRSLGYIQ